jgi:hypothetical protein
MYFVKLTLTSLPQHLNVQNLVWQIFSEFIMSEKKIGPDIVVMLTANCTPHLTSFGSTLCISVLLLDILL